MIQVFVFRVVCALQGGFYMVSHPSSPDVQVPPVQVWPALSLDLRTRVIGLLAQLVLNMVVTRLGNECAGKEGVYVEPTIVSKNPS
jgi:hypothetical protein